MSLWDHCQIGANPAGRPSHRRNQSTTRNKVDLRAHLAPHKEIDVYKVQAGHSFAKRPRDPFDLSKAFWYLPDFTFLNFIYFLKFFFYFWNLSKEWKHVFDW